MEAKDTPLSMKLEDGDLVIRIGIDRLAFCADHADEFNPYDEKIGNFVQQWRVSDKTEFAKDVAGQLCDQGEDGSTPFTRLLDKMSMAAMEDGSLGVEECPPGTPSIFVQDHRAAQQSSNQLGRA